MKYDFNYDQFLHEKGKFIFPFTYFLGSRSGIKDGRIRIRDTKKWPDPDPGSGINITDPQH
jgi:hypothetical protein